MKLFLGFDGFVFVVGLEQRMIGTVFELKLGAEFWAEK